MFSRVCTRGATPLHRVSPGFPIGQLPIAVSSAIRYPATMISPALCALVLSAAPPGVSLHFAWPIGLQSKVSLHYVMADGENGKPLQTRLDAGVDYRQTVQDAGDGRRLLVPSHLPGD